MKSLFARAVRLSFMAGLLACAGCQTGHYKAASLPSQLHAPPTVSTRSLQLSNLAAMGQNSSRLSVGDLLELHLASGAEEQPPQPQVVRVNEDGTIDAPMIGQVRVVGMEPSEASRAVAAAAVSRGIYRKPSVAIAVKEQATNQIMVLGAVAEPGQHSLPKNASDVLSAIAAAGGLTEDAGADVEVLRQSTHYFAGANEPRGPQADGVQQASYGGFGAPKPGKPVVQRISLAAISNSDPSSDTSSRRLSEHDVVMVLPKEEKVIHVTGLVREPNQFALSDDHSTRVLDAIAMAGGADSPVADKVLVLRQRPDGGEPVVIVASMSKAKRDGLENLVLAPGDLVSVESTVATTTVGTLRDFFRITMGVSGRLTAF